jgi:broad specificity phosphatase PhoE
MARWRLRLVLAPGTDVELAHRGSVPEPVFAAIEVPLLVDIDEHALVVSSPTRCALETAMPLVRRGHIPRERFLCQAELFEIGSRIYHREERPSEVAARLEADFALTGCEVPCDADYPAQPDKESDDQASARIDRVRAWAESLIADGAYDVILVITHGHFLSRWLRRWISGSSGRYRATISRRSPRSRLDSIRLGDGWIFLSTFALRACARRASPFAARISVPAKDSTHARNASGSAGAWLASLAITSSIVSWITSSSCSLPRRAEKVVMGNRVSGGGKNRGSQILSC